MFFASPLMTALLAVIPVLILGAGVPPSEVGLGTIPWGVSPSHFDSKFPGAVNSVTTTEMRDFANGYGIPNQRLKAKVFGLPGNAYLLYGRKSKLLVTITFYPDKPTACSSLRKSLRSGLGKPDEFDPALSTTTWQKRAGDSEVSFTSRSSSCKLSFLPSDPYSFW